MDAMGFVIISSKEHSRYLLQQIAKQAAYKLHPGQQWQLKQNLTLHTQLCTFLLECAASIHANHPDFPASCSLAADLVEAKLLTVPAVLTPGDARLQSYPSAEWTASVLERLQQLSAPLLQQSESPQEATAAAGGGTAAPVAMYRPAATTAPSSSTVGTTSATSGSSATQGSTSPTRALYTALNALSLLVGALCQVLSAVQYTGPSAAGTGTAAGGITAEQVASAQNNNARQFLPALQITEQYVRLVVCCPRPPLRTPGMPSDLDIPQKALAGGR
jgi:hypothetical protein